MELGLREGTRVLIMVRVQARGSGRLRSMVGIIRGVKLGLGLWLWLGYPYKNIFNYKTIVKLK